MKNVLRILKATLFAFILIFATSCDDETDNSLTLKPTVDIIGLASQNENLTSLVAAIKKVDLVATLQGDGPFTVFAPDNAAFASFLSANGFANLEAVPNDVLTAVLLNHVVAGDLTAGDLSTGLDVSSLATGAGDLNMSLSINTTDGVKVNGSTVITPNNDASNGTVHIVDAVIGLPTSVTFVTTNPSLSVLAEALTTATPDEDFATILSGDGPFTVFAPTNEAFTELLGRLTGFDSLDDFSTPQLQAVLGTILKYHVVSGAAVAAADLTDGDVITTFQEEDLIANVDGASVSFSDGDIVPASNVIIANVVASNAIIHAVDRVLLPASVVTALEGILLSPITDIAITTPALSTLVAALVAADGDLPSVLRGAGPFTVFAPTDTAFTSFLEANNFATLADVPVDVLTQVLLNHVVGGTNLSKDLVTGYVTTSSTAGAGGANLNMLVDITDGVKLNGVSSVVMPDVIASNGVVHVVDKVIGLPTIVDHALANSALTSLVGALTANGNTDFTDLLGDATKTFTVFAPINSAFTSFMNPNDNDINNILSNHVIDGTAAFSDALANSYVKTEAVNTDGDKLSLYINTDDGIKLNGSHGIVTGNFDIVATNGVIHAVSEVLDLPTVVTFATADPMFSSLVGALTADGQPDFVSVLSTPNGTAPAPFTVFAPINAAFAALEAVPTGDALTAVLQHHVIAGANVVSGDLTNGLVSPATLEGDTLTFSIDGETVTITDGAGNTDIGIIAVDVQAANGVIHAINKVMIADTTN